MTNGTETTVQDFFPFWRHICAISSLMDYKLFWGGKTPLFIPLPHTFLNGISTGLI